MGINLIYIAVSFKGQDLGLSQSRLMVGRIQHMRYEILGQNQFLRPKTEDVSSILTAAAMGSSAIGRARVSKILGCRIIPDLPRQVRNYI